MRPLIPIALLFSSALLAEDLEWIRRQAIPLKTVEAGHGFEDMLPLKKLVGDARIVSLGEATHGSREFFQLKHRMLEFLVKEMGFTIFSIEASMPEAYRLNDYVLEGKGDPRWLLKGMYFWTWDTEEVLAMIEWMREHNRTAAKKVRFTGFDMQTPGVAAGIVRDFVRAHDEAYLPVVNAAMKNALAAKDLTPGFGAVTAKLPAAPLAGKTIRYRGYLKTEGVKDGLAQLWLRADGGGKVLGFRNLGAEGPSGTTGWTKHEITFAVPAGAETIYFGTTLSGAGTAWYDSLAFEVDGAGVAEGIDLGFEADKLTGFAAGFFREYTTELDPAVFQTGRQSLRMRRTAPLAPAGSDPRPALREWEAIVAHLEAGDAARTPAAEWAIQNARVVLQGLQMKAKTVSRDASMARNVKWILDQSPDAKIVLWAHNGHVAAKSTAYRPMGQELRALYGDRMVVAGFAFHQGGFQAVEAGKELRDFQVGPAPEGSLDALLAAVGTPVFALDLRNAPAGLRRPLKTRTIGALYDANQASMFFQEINAPENFDVLLFVEKTSPARPTRHKGLAQGADGTFRDPDAGLTVRVPEGWTLERAARWGFREQTMTFKSAAGSAALYYAMKDARAPEQVAASLAGAVAEKTAQRLGEGFSGYRVRPGSERKHTVNGHPALSWVAEYAKEGQAMVEQFTRVESPTVLALFFTRSPAAEPLDVGALVESLRLPGESAGGSSR